VVIGTAQGDIHDIGKNMVALMPSNGSRSLIWHNVSPQAFIDAARAGADIIAMFRSDPRCPTSRISSNAGNPTSEAVCGHRRR
jgi:hypothetical protein